MRYGPTILADPSAEPLPYLDFVKAKAVQAPRLGLPVADFQANPILHRHQPVLVKWLVEGGRRALFANFGLGKTMIQLEAMRIIRDSRLPLVEPFDRVCLIVIPLTVVTEFKRDAEKLGLDVLFVRTTAEIRAAVDQWWSFCTFAEDGSLADPVPPLPIFLTNYESVREGKIDTSILTAVSLDEASCLRGFYLDIMAASEGIDLAEAIARKFNRTSEKVGFPERLAA